MHRIIYSIVFYLAVPLILLRLMLRSLRAPTYRRRIRERFALQRRPARLDGSKQTIWVHAVSVGETVASAPLIFELQRVYPDSQIVVTTMTPTGSDRVQALFGDSVMHSYIPYDLPGACNRFLTIYRPSLLILMETELWPNLVHACHRRGVGILLANARLSDRSAAGYRRFADFTSSVLRRIDRVAAQAAPDAERFIALGADASSVEVTGSLKFIVELGESKDEPYFSAIETLSRPVLVAGSTREGEEEKVLDAFERALEEIPSLLLILVPRHPERFTRIANMSEVRGLATARRSTSEGIDASTQVLIGDSMGEMIDYYRVATIAFVGGSLVDTGCQNVLEPAALGIPIVVGPSQYNFATICKQLEEAGALKTVQDESELALLITQLMEDEPARHGMGSAGKALVAANQNALPSLVKIVDSLIRTAA